MNSVSIRPHSLTLTRRIVCLWPWALPYGERHEKICLRCLRQMYAQINLPSYRDYLKSWKVAFSKFRYYTFMRRWYAGWSVPLVLVNNKIRFSRVAWWDTRIQKTTKVQQETQPSHFFLNRRLIRKFVKHLLTPLSLILLILMHLLL